MKKKAARWIVCAVALILFLVLPLDVSAFPKVDDGAVYIVNTTDNVTDSGSSACDSRHCSLQEAVMAANMHPGPDRITFQLPGDPPYIIYLGTPEGLTYMEMNIWDDETEIDATTQPGWPIYLHGLGEVGWGMIIHSNRNTVRGLGFLGFTEIGLHVEGENNFIDRVVAGDYLGEGFILAPIGNTTGILLEGNNNTLRGASVANNTTGIWTVGSGEQIEDCQIGFLTGSSARRGNETGIRLVGFGNTVTRNTISGNTEYGIYALSEGNIITRNWIGLDITRLHPLGNHVGINLFEHGGNQVGGTEAYEGNVIVGNDVGIAIMSPRNLIVNNRIGTDYAGTALPNGIGVLIALEGGNTLGQGWTGAGNVIAYNTEEGIKVNTASQVEIVGNMIFSNGGHGIELLTDFGTPPAEGLQVTINLNNIYDNGGLGIHVESPAVNRGILPPVITEANRVMARGTACPRCEVELFLAAPDPSGYGEGLEHITAIYADPEGQFYTSMRRLDYCDLITATATDELGNTSEFALNYSVATCFRMPPLGAWIWVIGAGGVGAALLGSLGRRRPPWLTWVIIGGLLGIGLAAGSLFLPFVQVTSPEKPSSQEGPAPLSPPCSQFLSAADLQPADRAVFQPGEDPFFGLSPKPDPPGVQTRWRVAVLGPEGDTGSLEFFGENTFSLSSLGLDPAILGAYYWKVSAEQQEANSDQWLPLCEDLFERVFNIGQAEQSLTIPPTLPVAIPGENANCRSGPSLDYPLLSILPAGGQYEIQARNTPGDSWMVFDPATNGTCWVSSDLVDVLGDTSLVIVIDPDPPTLILPTATTPFDCAQYNTNPNACTANQACWWDSSVLPNGTCKNK